MKFIIEPTTLKTRKLAGSLFWKNAAAILDRTDQWQILWSIIAAPSKPFQTGLSAARKWLENLPLSKEYNGYYYGASEYPIALSHLGEHTL